MKKLKDYSKEEIEDAVKRGTNYLDVLNILEIKVDGRARNYLKRYCDENNIAYDHLKPKGRVDYEQNPKLCKHCGKPIPWEKRENEYCNSSCAASENNKGKVRNKKKNKVKKVKICPVCGKEDCKGEFCRDHSIKQLIWLDRFGFDQSTIGTTKVFGEYGRIRNLVYGLYWDQGMSMTELGKEFNYSSKSGHIPKTVLDRLEIPSRSQSDAQRNFLLKNPDHKTPFSEDLFKKSLVTEEHISWNGKTFFLRSSYEIDFARKLDDTKTLYEVENLRIEYYDSQKEVNRVAIPDFYLPDTNEIVEIKSDFTLDIQEMLDKFDAYKKLGYSCKLILEKEEIDLYNIENILNSDRLRRIKTKNIKNFKTK